MADTWKPSKIEYDIILVVKDKETRKKRGLHKTEIVRFVLRAHPGLYNETEINDALTILVGKKFLREQVNMQKIPPTRDRFSNKITVSGRTHKLELYTVSDKGILYLREVQGDAQEDLSVRLYDAAEPYSTRRLFEGLFSRARSNIKIIDNYMGKKTLDYLLAGKGHNVPVKILTSGNKESGFDDALIDFSKEYDAEVEVQEKTGIFHGRVIIVDDQAYIIDHSIKDFGSKPSSIIKIEELAINEKYLELFAENWTN